MGGWQSVRKIEKVPDQEQRIFVLELEMMFSGNDSAGIAAPHAGESSFEIQERGIELIPGNGAPGPAARFVGAKPNLPDVSVLPSPSVAIVEAIDEQRTATRIPHLKTQQIGVERIFGCHRRPEGELQGLILPDR